MNQYIGSAYGNEIEPFGNCIVNLCAADNGGCIGNLCGNNKGSCNFHACWNKSK